MVIALVMFQPGCQSAKKSNLPDLNASATVEPDPLNSFNRGSETKTVDDPKPKDEFVTPTRPKPGEIIIPGGTVPPVPVEVDPIAGNDAVTKSKPLFRKIVPYIKFKEETLSGELREKIKFL